MDGWNLLPVFAVGLAGSVHCAGMCGGIVGALTAAGAPRNVNGNGGNGRGGARAVIAIVPAAAAARPVRSVAAAATLRVLSYNAGRIASYMAAGALAGGLAGGVATLAGIAAWQSAAYWLANLMLAALGLYLMDAWRGLALLEAGGRTLWRRIEPLIAPLLPMDTPAKAFALGGLWGWLPCGMVYSMLLTAMLSGSAAHGAAVMFAFGAGTVPMLLALGLAGARLRALLHAGGRARRLRIACGLLVLGFAVAGLARAAAGADSIGHDWLDALCISAPGASQ